MLIIKILALVGAWLLFYNVLKSRNKSLPALKATIITLIFAALLFRVATNLYAFIDKSIFSYNKHGEVSLVVSPLRIPSDRRADYCKQFTDESGRVIDKVSSRQDGQYCGEFWQFDTKEDIILPYKNLNSNQVLYWASPFLKIVGSKQDLESHR